MNRFLALLLVFAYVVVLPLGCLAYLILPATKIGKAIRQPFIKFLGHAITYLTFLCAIVVTSILQESSQQGVQFSTKYPDAYAKYYEYVVNATILDIPEFSDFAVRSYNPLLIEYIISVFIIGFVLNECKQVFTDGLVDYVASWYNLLDTSMLILYLTTYTLRYYTCFRVYYAVVKAESDDVWLRNSTKEIGGMIYWLVNDRFYWEPLDPINLTEGLFAIANILSFSRISYLLPANQHLGPLQISLGRMMGDIAKFCAIFAVVIAAFLIGLNNLYWYYSPSIRVQSSIVDHGTTDAESYFGTIELTFQTVFWSIFGLGNQAAVRIDQYNNTFTRNMGYVLYGVYSVGAIIVLLNMLIAMMSKSFQAIQEDADVEWKFARSRLYMEYIKEGSNLPVPFNIIPSPVSVFAFLRWLFCKSCKKKEGDIGFDEDIGMQEQRGGRLPTHFANHYAKEDNPTNGAAKSNFQRASFSGDNLTHSKVISRIVKRFILQQQRDEQEEITDGDFDEIKQDISSLRFEMRNELRHIASAAEKMQGISELADGISSIQSLFTKLHDGTSNSPRSSRTSSMWSRLMKGRQPGPSDTALPPLDEDAAPQLEEEDEADEEGKGEGEEGEDMAVEKEVNDDQPDSEEPGTSSEQ